MSQTPSGLGTENQNELDLLDELQSNTPEAIVRSRASTRLAIRSRIIVQPGNASEARSLKLQGITGDISEGGMQVLLPTPVGVGDIFRISFDREVVDLPMTFARCLRCRLVKEDAFEAGFAFFKPIALSAHVLAPAESASR